MSVPTIIYDKYGICEYCKNKQECLFYGCDCVVKCLDFEEKGTDDGRNPDERAVET